MPLKYLYDVLHGTRTGSKAELLRETRLTKHQLRILSLHLGFVDGREWTFAEIGAHYGVSPQTASKSFNAALNKVRAWAQARVRT